jgi:hypothetical protein
LRGLVKPRSQQPDAVANTSPVTMVRGKWDRLRSHSQNQEVITAG